MPRFVHYLYLIPLGLGALLSLRTFKEDWPRPYRFFSFLLWGTILIEALAIAWKLQLHDSVFGSFSKSNGWVYNLYYMPAYLAYLYFYRTALDKSMLNAKLCRVFAFALILLGITNILFIQGIFSLNSYTIVAGSGLVLYGALNYFRQELARRQPKKMTDDPLFWISTGAFIFHTVSLPYFIFINDLSAVNLPLAIALFNIVLVLNFFMHTTYTIAFLCSPPFPKKLI